MTTTVYESKSITLLNDQEIKIRPLKISLLRDFMKEFEKIDAVSEDNSKSIDVLIKCVQIAMKQYAPELSTDKAVLEDILDLPTVYKIVEAASGSQLGDMNLSSI
jgi:hypothetical protein